MLTFFFKAMADLLVVDELSVPAWVLGTHPSVDTLSWPPSLKWNPIKRLGGFQEAVRKARHCG